MVLIRKIEVRHSIEARHPNFLTRNDGVLSCEAGPLAVR
jgi:hypothetical protein